jgi:hypothetical protein
MDGTKYRTSGTRGGKLFLILVAVGLTYLLEWMTIAKEAYPNWEAALVGVQIYIAITFLTIFVYALMFRRSIWQVGFLFVMYDLLIVMPIGAYISITTGYSWNELTSLSWLFTHDFVIDILLCQALVSWLMLIALMEKQPIADGFEEYGGEGRESAEE